MASQLSLRIASTLDKSGFTQVKQQSAEMVKNLRDVQSQTLSLGNAFRGLTAILTTAFAVNQIRGFIQQSIEQERALNTLANRLTLLGENGVAAARGFDRLTAAQSTQTRFSQTEQLQALNLILRSAKSTAEATKTLTVAQDLAVASGVSLATASLALQRAQSGTGFFLPRLTGLTTAQITEFRKLGTIVDEVGTKVRGFARKDVETLGGALEVIRNKFQNAGQAIGDIFTPALSSIAKAVRDLDQPTAQTALAATAISTSFVAVGSAAALLRPQLLALGTAVFSPVGLAAGALAATLTFLAGSIFRTLDELKGIRDEEIRAAEGTQVLASGLERVRKAGDAKPFSSIQVGISQLRREILALNQLIAKTPEGFRAGLLETRGELRKQLKEFESTRKSEVEIGELSIEKLKEQNKDLTKSKNEARTIELLNQRIHVQELVNIAKKAGLDQESLLLKLKNIDIEFSNLSTENRLRNFERQAEAANTLLSLFERTLQPLDPAEATSRELTDRRAALLSRVRLTKEAIEEELNARLTATERQGREEGTSVEEIERKKNTIRLEAQVRLAEELRRTSKELEVLEPAIRLRGTGVKSLAEQFQKEAERIERETRLKTEVIIKFDDAEHQTRVRDAVIRTLREFGITESRRTVAPAGEGTQQ